MLALIACSTFARGQAPELVVQTGNSSPANTVAVTADGKYAATSAKDGNIILWNTDEQAQLRTIRSGESVSFLAFTDSETLISAGRKGSVAVWDVKSGHEIRSFKALTFPADGAKDFEGDIFGNTVFSKPFALSPDNTQLAGANYDGTVTLYDVLSGEKRATVGGIGPAKTNLAFRSDGNAIATLDNQHKVQILDIRSNESICEARGSAGSILFSPDGKLLLNASNSAAGLLLFLQPETCKVAFVLGVSWFSLKWRRTSSR